MGSVVDAYCKGCHYRGTVSGGRCCNFYAATGQLRGCPAGEGCIRHTGKKQIAEPPPLPEPIPMPVPEPTPEPEPAPAAPPPPKKREYIRGRTLEEAYERDKERKRERAAAFKAKAQGRQRAVLLAYKEETGYSNGYIATKIGVSEGQFRKWLREYGPADWEKLAVIGVEKPEGLE